MPLTIEAAELAARIAPELGGMVTAFWSRREPDVLHWLHPVPDELVARTLLPKGGMFVLAPFSNRIRAGRFAFRGRALALGPHPEVGPDAQHGYAARLPWRVTARTPSAVALECDDTGGGWPWAVTLRQTLTLEDGALVARLEVLNRDREPMPVGGGFHPFLARTGGQRLAVQAGCSWHTDAMTRPLERVPAGAGAAARDLALDPFAGDRFLGEWDGLATVTFPGLDGALRLEADPAGLPYLLLFCPPGRPVICIEPVSHLTGAFELPEAEAVVQGMRILDPGETWAVALRLRPLPAIGKP
jgi:aldose 1-epimerase